MKSMTVALAILGLCVLAPAQKAKPKAQSQPTAKAKAKTQKKDDFQRERRVRKGKTDARSAAKDKLEGKKAPPLQVAQWMNIEGKSLSLDSLRGKVIAIKFWGVW